jgi:hypothetical protein
MTTLQDRLSPHLPLLRRYARALAGRQDVGDYAAARLIADVHEQRLALPDGVSPRLALYQYVAKTLAALGLIETTDSNVTSIGLPQVTSLARHALLLLAVEKLTPDQSTQILAVGPDALYDLCQRGLQELTTQDPTSVLVIERDRLACLDWEMWLAELGHTIVGPAHTRDGARALAEHTPPGLLVTGTLLEGSFAHDLINDIAQASAAPWVIVSSYPEFSLTAERQGAEAAYILHKRDDDMAFKTMIGQALFVKGAGLANYQLPQDASALLKQSQEHFWVIVSTIATRQFAYMNGARDDCDYFPPSFHAFLDRKGFSPDVKVVSIPSGLVSYRSHAKVTLRKNPWTTLQRFGEIINDIYRELRDPKPGIALPMDRRMRD